MSGRVVDIGTDYSRDAASKARIQTKLQTELIALISSLPDAVTDETIVASLVSTLNQVIELQAICAEENPKYIKREVAGLILQNSSIVASMGMGHPLMGFFSKRAKKTESSDRD